MLAVIKLELSLYRYSNPWWQTFFLLKIHFIQDVSIEINVDWAEKEATACLRSQH